MSKETEAAYRAAVAAYHRDMGEYLNAAAQAGGEAYDDAVYDASVNAERSLWDRGDRDAARYHARNRAERAWCAPGATTHDLKEAFAENVEKTRAGVQKDLSRRGWK